MNLTRCYGFCWCLANMQFIPGTCTWREFCAPWLELYVNEDKLDHLYILSTVENTTIQGNTPGIT